MQLLQTHATLTSKNGAKMQQKKQNHPAHHAKKDRISVQKRRKIIVKAIAEGKTEKEAGILAGLSPKTATTQVSNIMKKPEMQANFRQLLEKIIPDSLQVAKYRELLDATALIGKNLEKVPDYPTQLRANNSVAKLKGHWVDRANVSVVGLEDVLEVLEED